MRETTVLELADHTLNAVVARIRDDQWDILMPASFASRGADHPPTLREIIGYHAYDDAWVPDMLAGRTMAEVGVEAFKGDLLGDDPRGAFARIVDLAVAAARDFEDPLRTVHCSFGEPTGRSVYT